MSGILGVYAFDRVWNVGKFLYYGLIGLQHRGYSHSGIVTLGNEGFTAVIDKAAPEDLEIDELRGWAGVGYTGTRPGYPLVTDYALPWLTV
nr:hypothetical protein [Vulcanisaeta sp. JCM 14467]